MSTPNPNPTKFTWTPAATNTDGTPLTDGEITGYTLGIRSTTAAGSVAGTYPILASITDPKATEEAIASIGTVLKPDTYAAAIRSEGPEESAWTSEVTFPVSAPVPNPPSAFAVS